MDSVQIAGLVKVQTPEHAQCRAQELVEVAPGGSAVIVQCACNVRLTLAVFVQAPKEKEESDGT